MLRGILSGGIRREGGATAVEYAIVLPILLLMVMGILEYNTIMYASTILEGAVGAAAREGSTGYTQTGLSRQQFIQNYVQARVQGIMKTGNLTFSSKSYANFADIGKPEPCITVTCGNGHAGVDYVDVNGNGIWDADQGTAGLGGSGDIVVYTASYPWPVYTPVLSSFMGTSFNISSSAVVKNEPYSTGMSR